MSTQALRERLDALNREAKNMLADKGSATWSKDEQTKFDNLMEEAERTQRQVEAHKRLMDTEAEEQFKDVQRNSAGKGQPTDQERALNVFLRKADNARSADERELIRNTMSTTTPSEGGYAVQASVAQQIIESIRSYGSMRRVAGSVFTEQGNDLSYPTTDGTSELGEIVAQNAPASSADAVFGTRALNVFKFSSKVVTVPIELLQDASIDIAALVRGRIGTRVGRIQNQLFTIGTGTGQPLGLVPAATVGKVGATGQVTSILYDDLVDIVDSLDVAYTDEAANAPQWMFNQTLRRTLRKLKDTAGRPLWTPSYDAGIAGGRADQLMGFDVVINNDMPTPAANAKSLAFGQLGQYMVRDAMAVTLYRFDDSAFATKGQVGFLAFARAGGNLMDVASAKVYQHSAT